MIRGYFYRTADRLGVMAEQECPRCKTTSYRNPNLKLLVNVCGHKLCQTCVDVLFTRPSAACPECSTPLRRSDFRIQQFEDAFVEREVDVRKKIVKIFNKREEDFSDFQDPLRAYNDYLEDVEVIIFNLVNKVDVEATRKRVDKYKRDHDAAIKKINSKISHENEKLKLQMEIEWKESEEKRRKFELEEELEKKAKNKERDALIDDLIHANTSADEVLARHHMTKLQVKKEEEKKSMFFQGKSKSQNVNVNTKSAPLYKYEPLDLPCFGPALPTDREIISQGYTKNIRQASASERAAGYTESIACQRALSEAFNGLFF